MENKFLLLTKIHFLNNWKFILVWLSVFFLSCLVFENNFKRTDLAIYDARALWWLSLMLYTVIAISFKDYFAKSRTMSITLPANSSIKFFVILFQSFVIYPLLLLVMYIINHYLQGLILCGAFDFAFLYGINEWLNIILCCAIFFLSSVLFGRFAILYGIGFILSLSLILWSLIFEGSRLIITHPKLIPINYEQFPAILPIVLLLVVGMIYLAWWKFKRFQIK